MSEEEKKEEQVDEEPGDGSIHVSGEFECRCGAIKDFGPDFTLPSPPYEIKCDACGAVLIQGEYSEEDDTEEDSPEDAEG